MGNIPLVALAGRQPEIEPYQNQVAQAQQIQALKNRNALFPGEQQLQQQQIEASQQAIQAGQLENQMRQQQLKDQQAMTQAMQEWDPTDIDSLPGLVLKHGGSGKAVLELKKGLVDQQIKYLDMNQKQRDIEKLNNDYFAQAIDKVKSLPLDQQAAGFQAAVTDAVKHGYLDPKQAQGLQYQGPQQLDLLEKSYMGHAAVLAAMDKANEAAKAQAQTNLFAAQLPGATAESAIKQKELEMMNQGGGAVPGIPLEVQEANSWLATHKGKTLADYQRYKATLVPAFNFNLQAQGVPLGGAPAAAAAGKSPSDIEASIPANIKPTVMAVLEGRQSPPGSFALKTPYWQNVMNSVYAIDPQWSEQRAQLRKAYTTGPQSKEINAINTAMGHVGVLNDAIDALNNGNIKILNSIANRLGVETGNDAATTFTTIVHRVGPELSKAYIGAGGSAGERGADEKDFDPALGAKQLKSNVAVTAQLLRSKIGSLENQWNQNKSDSMPSFEDRFITPEAKTNLDRLNPQGGGATLPEGKGKFIDKATAMQFYRAAGNDPDKARQLAIQNGWKVGDSDEGDRWSGLIMISVPESK